MALKPWYRVVTPRADLREGKPLDAAEFAVHLDQVRDGRAPADYQRPERFFERTFLTQNLIGLAAEVLRRLSGERTETSAVFNMATAFGGGKTHALTLLYHLAHGGPAANGWVGVLKLLDAAGLHSVPQAATAVFVGTEFDSLTGRGGEDGTPLRKTPWGEIAFQLGGAEAFAHVAEHERTGQAPAGDVIRRFLPKDRPSLILVDELMNYASRNRRSGLSAQMYSFLENLSETARGMDNVVLVVSIPASELEMTAEDHADYTRFRKMLNRLGKAVIMAAEAETAEIIRRRLFEWDPRAVGQDGRVLLPHDALETCSAYADWVLQHRKQVPSWFPVDRARETFAATYPFHPALLSVFERKWQTIPDFQRTRGILRLLALWVSHAYRVGFRGAHRDALIDVGTAPLDDSLFRAAVLEQLGESRWDPVITADICGSPESHAIRLDQDAVETIQQARLHRKVAAAIFFESNGGTVQADASLPELRLALASPDLDAGNVETVLDAMTGTLYYLVSEGNRYRFGLTVGLNKLLADRLASVSHEKVDERLRSEVEKVFSAGPRVQRVYFPELSNQIPDHAALTVIAMAPQHCLRDPSTLPLLDSMTRECGTSGRTFKSALLWAVADDDRALHDEATKVLAWEDIRDHDAARLDEAQRQQLPGSIKLAQRDLHEAVWRTYKNVLLLGKDNGLRMIDLGLVHSSAADSLVTLILNRLRQDGELVDSVSPSFLLRNWPSFPEWSTRSVRDAFFASPRFPRLSTPDAVKETIARGVSSGALACVGKGPGGEYEPFMFQTAMNPADVEISDDVLILTAEEAEKRRQPPVLTTLVVSPARAQLRPGERQVFSVSGLNQHGRQMALPALVWSATGGQIGADGVLVAGSDEGSFSVSAQAQGITASSAFDVSRIPPPPPPPPPAKRVRMLSWKGEIPAQKWMNFYLKVLSRFATGAGLKLTLHVEVTQESGIPEAAVEETKVALRELGLDDEVKSSG